MEFDNKDFNADKPKPYEGVTKTLASIYSHQPNWFSPVEESKDALSEKNYLDITLIKEGQTRVQDKIKEVRQSFSSKSKGWLQQNSSEVL